MYVLAVCQIAHDSLYLRVHYVCLLNTLSHRAGTLQISMIIIIKKTRKKHCVHNLKCDCAQSVYPKISHAHSKSHAVAYKTFTNQILNVQRQRLTSNFQTQLPRLLVINEKSQIMRTVPHPHVPAKLSCNTVWPQQSTNDLQAVSSVHITHCRSDNRCSRHRF